MARMFTARDARQMQQDDLDERIERAVREAHGGRASMRVYCEDAWLPRLREELERRGFINIRIPDIIIKGDVEFGWPMDEEDWYARQDELVPGMVFRTAGGDLVRLDRRVPGDGTAWYADTWWGRSWACMDARVEPGDLVERLPDNYTPTGTGGG